MRNESTSSPVLLLTSCDAENNRRFRNAIGNIITKREFPKGFFCCTFKQYIRKSELLTWGMMQCDSQLPDEKRTESYSSSSSSSKFSPACQVPCCFVANFLISIQSLQTCTQDELEERKNIRASSKSAALSAPMSATLSAILASHVLQETTFHTYSN